jgi:hypothetical protein
MLLRLMLLLPSLTHHPHYLDAMLLNYAYTMRCLISVHPERLFDPTATHQSMALELNSKLTSCSDNPNAL